MVLYISKNFNRYRYCEVAVFEDTKLSKERTESGIMKGNVYRLTTKTFHAQYYSPPFTPIALFWHPGKQ